MSRDLNLLDSYVKYLAEKLMSMCKEDSQLQQKCITVIISQTFRTIKEQNEYYAQGRTKPGKIVTNAKGGQSVHNYGYAFDVFLHIKGVECADKEYFRVGELGESIGLEWGGSWTSFKDYPHFQYVMGLDIKDFIAGKRPNCPPVPIDEPPEEVKKDLFLEYEESEGFVMFVEEYYLKANPDIAEAVAAGKIPSGRWHFENQGRSENRRGYAELPAEYNEGAYLENNPDVKAAVQSGGFTCGAAHYIKHGWNEPQRIYK